MNKKYIRILIGLHNVNAKILPILVYLSVCPSVSRAVDCQLKPRDNKNITKINQQKVLICKKIYIEKRVTNKREGEKKREPWSYKKCSAT